MPEKIIHNWGIFHCHIRLLDGLGHSVSSGKPESLGALPHFSDDTVWACLKMCTPESISKSSLSPEKIKQFILGGTHHFQTQPTIIVIMLLTYPMKDPMRCPHKKLVLKTSWLCSALLRHSDFLYIVGPISHDTESLSHKKKCVGSVSQYIKDYMSSAQKPCWLIIIWVILSVYIFIIYILCMYWYIYICIILYIGDYYNPFCEIL